MPVLPLFCACLLSVVLRAQTVPTPPDTTRPAAVPKSVWKDKGFLQLNLNQVSFANWTSGGENAISGATLLHYSFAYRNADSSTTWESSADLGYGETWVRETGFRKNDDRIDLNSKFGKRADTKLNYSAVFSFKSQFAPGYTYPNDSVVISRFMAPGFVVLSLGLDYRPKSYFSVFLSPATGKGTFVLDPVLADSGAFGVEKAVFDAQGNKIRSGRRFRPEFGAYLEAKLNKELMKNVTLQSRLNLFNNYTDRKLSNRRNIDVNWQSTLNMKVNEYIAANLFVHLIYDNDILTPETKVVDGVEKQVAGGPKIQFKQALGIGFSYKFVD